MVQQLPLPATHQHDQVITDALVHPQAAMTGEENSHLADSVYQASGRFQVIGLSKLQHSVADSEQPD